MAGKKLKSNTIGKNVFKNVGKKFPSKKISLKVPKEKLKNYKKILKKAGLSENINCSTI